LGSSSMACVMVPASTQDVRSCGIRAVPLLAAIWLGNWILVFGWPIVNGVRLIGTAAIVTRSADPGIAQAYVFLAFAAITICSLPLILLVPDHHGRW
jgi:hypothetical protein